MIGKTLRAVVRYIFFGIYSLCILYPMFFILMSSFKTNEEIFTTPFALPNNISLDNYIDIFVRFDMHFYFLNSLYYSVVGCLVIILICSMAAYAIGRMKWKLSKPVLAFFLLGLMVPMHSVMVPLFISTRTMGFTNNRITLIGIFAAFAIPTSVFIITSFMRSLPREMEESAVIDGSGLLRCLFQIILPMTAPAIATVTIFNFIGIWNDLLFALIFLTRETEKTIQLGITRFQGAFSINYSLMLSAIVISILPTLITYIFLQRRIVSGMTAGALKG